MPKTATDTIEWIEIVHGPTTIRCHDHDHRDFSAVPPEITRGIAQRTAYDRGVTFWRPLKNPPGVITIFVENNLSQTEKEELAKAFFDNLELIGLDFSGM